MYRREKNPETLELIADALSLVHTVQRTTLDPWCKIFIIPLSINLLKQTKMT